MVRDNALKIDINARNINEQQIIVNVSNNIIIKTNITGFSELKYKKNQLNNIKPDIEKIIDKIYELVEENNRKAA